MEPKIINLDSIKVLYIRKLGSYVKSGEEAWKALLNFAGPKGLLNNKPAMFGLSYDDPALVSAEKLRYEACIEVDSDVEQDGDFKVQTIGGGKYLVVLHVGAWDKVHDAYVKAFDWLKENKVDCRIAPCIEKYLNTPDEVDIENLKTEVYIPIK